MYSGRLIVGDVVYPARGCPQIEIAGSTVSFIDGTLVGVTKEGQPDVIHIARRDICVTPFDHVGNPCKLCGYEDHFSPRLYEWRVLPLRGLTLQVEGACIVNRGRSSDRENDAGKAFDSCSLPLVIRSS